MSRSKLALLSTAVTCALIAGTAHAQGQITRLIVAADKDATSGVESFPKGTKSFWAIFDYERGDDSDITVEVVSAGGATVFSSDSKYSDSGKARVEVKGSAIYANIMDELGDVAEATESALVKVGTQQQVTQYVSDVLMNVSQMDALVKMIESSDYRGLDQQQLSSLTTSMDSLMSLKTELQRATDEAQKRAKASEMEPHVATAAAAVAALADASVPDFPIPPSPSQSEGGQYLIKVEVDGYPSKSTEVWVIGDSTVAPERQATSPNPTQSSARGTQPSSSATTVPGQKPTEFAGGTGAPTVPGGALGGLNAVKPGGVGTPGTLGTLGRGTTTTTNDPNAPVSGDTSDQAGIQPPAEGIDQAADPFNPSAQATSYTVQGVPGNANTQPSGGSGALDSPDSSGPNFVVLLVGVVVLAGVAVFMKGRM